MLNALYCGVVAILCLKKVYDDADDDACALSHRSNKQTTELSLLTTPMSWTSTQRPMRNTWNNLTWLYDEFPSFLRPFALMHQQYNT